jgi:proteasome lid subunit RPN8/RPN11
VTEVRIGPVAADVVKESCSGGYPLESCGLLIGTIESPRITVTRALRCPNAAPPEVRTHRFSIDPRVVINVRRSLRGGSESIVGFFHSHPDAAAAPSKTDLEHIRLWPEVVWLIVPVYLGSPAEPRGWWLDEEGDGPRELAVIQEAPRLLVTCEE